MTQKLDSRGLTPLARVASCPQQHQERLDGNDEPGNLAERSQRCRGRGLRPKSDVQVRKGLNNVFSWAPATLSGERDARPGPAEGPFLVCDNR